MDYFIQTLKKLALISVLSTNITESSVISGAIFSDIRTSLYSRMLELTRKNWDPLALYRFIESDTDKNVFQDWYVQELVEYANKDVYINPSYLHTTDNNIFKYQLEPKHIDHRYLYYNLSPLQVTWTLQRLGNGIKFFPCRFSLYVESNIDNIIREVYKKHEPHPKTSNYTSV